MAKAQRDISVSEFFAKNRHLLGFDNPRKALLTTVKEAVDNSLDACEEGGILPEIVSGAEVVAIVLSLETTGPLLIKALQSQDMYLAGSFLMFLALLTVIGVLLSDIALAFLDPRIRLQGASTK